MSSPRVLHDYYKILEIPREADIDSIKTSYKRLARIRHPDKNSSSTATSEFQLLQEAYSTLVDPQSRKSYDAQYTFTKFHHTPPQANPSTNSASPATHEKTHKVSALTLQIRELKSRLHKQEAELRLARLRLERLHGEIASLDQEIENIEREKSGKATWWGFFTSILQGHQETEEERIKRDNDRLQKVAARSIRESNVQREMAVVRGLENAINAIHSSITSAEFKIFTEKRREEREEQEKRRLEEERLRQEVNRRMAEEFKKRQERQAQQAEKRRMEEERLRQEANRRMAEELKKQRERQAQQANREHRYPSREQGVNGSRNSGQSEGKQNFRDEETCHHQAWWSQIDVPASCSRCSSITRKFIFKCPGCGKLACAPCRDTIKGGRFRPNRFGKGAYHNSSDYTEYFDRFDYFD
ncbi:hypothetical protein BJY01DRAFT_261902 [Aspergillus pseudoustus]|uniref:J domain-containing protein n=1 Tax=Aspergillus pseudoustus TaxID=1810923 RepID=A0ABR4IKP3_9EURO